MIVILEGVNGVGKTTVANQLAEHFGFRRFKAFRPMADCGHWDDGDGVALREKLEAVGVPVNTHVEDLFIADFVRKFPEQDIILDRSLPSAYAYESVEGEAFRDSFQLWKDMLGPLRPVYIYMKADHEAVVERCVERAPEPVRFDKMNMRFGEVFAYLEANWEHVYKIDTTSSTKIHTWKLVRNAIEHRRSAQ